MKKTTQFTVLLENNPGELAKLIKIVAKVKANLQALTTVDAVHHAVIKLVVDKPDAVRRALQKAGVGFSEQPVVLLSVPDRPGALAALCAKLAAKEININYVYGSACGCTCTDECQCACLLVLSVDDAKAAKAILKGKH